MKLKMKKSEGKTHRFDLHSKNSFGEWEASPKDSSKDLALRASYVVGYGPGMGGFGRGEGHIHCLRHHCGTLP